MAKLIAEFQEGSLALHRLGGKVALKRKDLRRKIHQKSPIFLPNCGSWANFVVGLAHVRFGNRRIWLGAVYSLYLATAE
jgi:hypothetical protein